MRKALLAAAVAAVPMFVAVPAAHADDTTCTTGVVGGPHDNVVVPAGAFCELFGAEVGGNVKVLAGGTLLVADSSVAGDIQAEPGHIVVQLFAGTIVGGDVQLKGSVASGFASGYDGAVIGGDFQYEENANFLLAANGDIGGNFTAGKNTGGGEIFGNTIGGNLECKENTPAITQTGNVVEGETKCPEV